jgi:hypothetical protein
MITVTAHPTVLFSLHVEVDGIAVFLDHFAIKELSSKFHAARRKRFITALDRGARVLFSVGNAAELAGPLGDSFLEMRSFMDEIGPRWFPVELIPEVVIKKESAGKSLSACCVCEDLLKSFTATRIRDIPATQIFAFTEDFFRLGLFMDWLAPQRDSLAAGRAGMDDALIEQIRAHRAKHEADPHWLDTAFPARPFESPFPARFAYLNLVRTLILEAKEFRLKRGDGIDFCQAVIGSAYSSVATLDKHWKRRIESLPKPNGLAKVYCSPHLDEMIDEIERNLDLLTSAKRSGS